MGCLMPLPLGLLLSSRCSPPQHTCRPRDLFLHPRPMDAAAAFPFARYSYPNPGPPAHQLVQPGICYQIIHIHNPPPHTGLGKNHEQPSPSSSCHPGLTSHTPAPVADTGMPTCSGGTGQAQGHLQPSLTSAVGPKSARVSPPRSRHLVLTALTDREESDITERI